MKTLLLSFAILATRFVGDDGSKLDKARLEGDWIIVTCAGR